MPFAALRGLDEALRAKEAEFGYEEKKQLSEDRLQALDLTVRTLTAGDRVRITFYREARYTEEDITFRGYDVRRRLLLSDDSDFPLDDISGIERL